MGACSTASGVSSGAGWPPGACWTDARTPTRSSAAATRSPAGPGTRCGRPAGGCRTNRAGRLRQLEPDGARAGPAVVQRGYVPGGCGPGRGRDLLAAIGGEPARGVRTVPCRLVVRESSAATVKARRSWADPVGHRDGKGSAHEHDGVHARRAVPTPPSPGPCPNLRPSRRSRSRCPSRRRCRRHRGPAPPPGPGPTPTPPSPIPDPGLPPIPPEPGPPRRRSAA